MISVPSRQQPLNGNNNIIHHKNSLNGISVEAIFMMDSFFFLIAQSVSTRLPAFVRPE